MYEHKHALLDITELFAPTKGGTAVWIDQVYRRIGAKEIHVLTASVPGDSDHDRHHPNRIYRIRLRRRSWMRPESLGMYLNFLLNGLKIGLMNPIDAVHAGRVLPEGFVGWLIAKMLRKPLIIYAHGEEITTWREPAKYRFMRFTYLHASQVIANSDFTKQELLKIGVDLASISLISPGVNIDHFRPGLETRDLLSSVGLSENSKLILSVGRLSRRKGFDQVLRAVAKLRSEGIIVDYAIVGIGQDQNYLKALANELAIDRYVHFLAEVPAEDLPRWYNACTVFAMPNREVEGDVEGFGMVFLESAACGKAAVSGISGGTGSAVVDGETGIRVNGESLNDVTDRLRCLLTDMSYRDYLSQNAYKRAIGEYCWQSVAAKTRLVNDSVLSYPRK